MKIKVKVDGTVHEVESDAVTLPEGARILTAEDIKESYIPKSAFNSRFSRKLKKAKEELLDDDEFFAEMANSRGVDLEKGGASSEALAEAKASAASYKKKYEDAASLSDGLLSDVKRGSIYQGAIAAGIKKDYLSDELPFMDGYMKRFGRNGDTGQIALVDGDDFAYSEDPERIKSKKPYKEPKEFFLGLKKDPKFAFMFEDNRGGSSGLDGSGGGNGTTESFSRDQLRKMSDAEYAKHRDKIHAAQSAGTIQ